MPLSRHWFQVWLTDQLFLRSWPTIMLVLLFYYFVSVSFFAVLLYACGPDSILGLPGNQTDAEFKDAFYLSVQSLSTIGYGSYQPSPDSVAANILISLEGFWVCQGERAVCQTEWAMLLISSTHLHLHARPIGVGCIVRADE